MSLHARVILLLLALLCASYAHADCTLVGGNVSTGSQRWSCHYSGEAQAKIRPLSNAACDVNYGTGFTVADQQIANAAPTVLAWYSDGHCEDPNNHGLHYLGYDRADYTDTSSPCTVGTNGPWIIFSNQGDSPAAPATICHESTPTGCLANFTPNGAPAYIMSSEVWRQDGSFNYTGEACSNPTPPQSQPPPLPDTDHDGIPDNQDPYPNDPTNTPPPPPTPPPQNPPPTPPSPSPATNTDIATLEKVLGDKLDALARAIAATKAAVDSSAASQNAANTTNANAIISAIHGITPSSSSATDMTATNEKLDSIKANTDPIHSTATPPDYHTANDGDSTVQSDAYVTDNGTGNGGPDTSGFGWARTCPESPTIDFPRFSLRLNFTPACHFFQLFGVLVLIVCGILSAKIIAGAK